jgi:outer membrane lipoprotein-sorting protein
MPMLRPIRRPGDPPPREAAAPAHRSHAECSRAPGPVRGPWPIASLLGALGILVIAVVCGLPASPATADDLMPPLEPAPAGVDALELARAAEKAMRSDTTHMKARMIVRSPRLSSDRVVAFESWDDLPGKRSLIRIEEPSKDRGTGFLKQHPNLWMYVPRVERTVRIPPSMMMQSWMGSDFTNDDLVNESSDVDDYVHTMLGVDPKAGKDGDTRAYVIEYVPKEETAVVWGKIIGWVDAKTKAPLRQDFYDEDGEAIRTLVFEDIRKQGKRWVPHHWQLTPLDKEGHRTTIEIDLIEFDVDLDDDIFTTRNLKRTN